MRKKATVWALALAMSVQMLAVSGVSAADFSSGETGSVFSENTETDSGNSVPVTEETPTDNSAGSSVEEEQTETSAALPEEAEPTEDVEIFGSSEVIPDESEEFSGKDSLEVLGDPEGAAASEIPEEERKDLSACTVQMASKVYCTGQALTPDVTVKTDAETLAADRDYTLEYTNNTMPGTASVKITGIGGYKGEVTKTFRIILQTPELVSAVSTGYNSVQFTWKAVPGAQCYKVYYKGQTAKTWKTLKKDVMETSFHHVSSKTFPLTTGKKYVYTVRAVYGSMLSSCNKTGKVVTPKVAAATLGTVTSAAYNKLKITWSAVEGATGYAIYRRSGSAWQKIAVTSATSYIHTSSSQFPVNPGETYTYTVRSYRKMGKSTYSWGNYNKTGIQGKAVPNKPALVSAVYQDPGKITITWKKAAGATHYMIFWKNSKGQWAQIAKVSADNLSYTHVSSDKFPIEKGKTYIYTVRSYTTTGNTRGLYDKKGKTVEAVNPTEEVDKKLKEVTTKILSQITNSSMTKAQKLRACWNFVTSGANFSYWPKYPNTSQVGWQRTTALDMLTTRRGNCYSFACGFAALAKEIGYSPSVVCGRVSGSRDGSSDGMTRHSWVVIGGTYYDPEAHYAGWYKNVYGSGSYDVNHTIQSIVSF